MSIDACHRQLTQPGALSARRAYAPPHPPEKITQVFTSMHQDGLQPQPARRRGWHAIERLD
jgi:hypothetical protein